MNDLVTVRHRINGGIAKVHRHIAEHEVFGEHLEIVPDGTKPLIPLTKIVDDARPKPLAPPKVEVKKNDLEEEED